MNSKYKFGLFLAGILAVCLMSFGGPGSKTPQKTFTTSTLVNTETDTLTVPLNLVSSYSYCFSINLTTNTGTRAMKGYLQESNVLNTATDWVTIDSFIPTTTQHQYRLRGDRVYGRHQRLLLKGNAGATQNVTYITSAGYKEW